MAFVQVQHTVMKINENEQFDTVHAILDCTKWIKLRVKLEHKKQVRFNENDI